MKSKAFLLLLSLPFLCAAQSKYDKLLKKAEASYVTGDYSKAVSSLEKFRKKTTKKLGAQNKYTPVYHLTAAKYSLASGMVLEFESSLMSAVTANTLLQDNTAEGANLLIDAAVLYNQNGSFRKARELLDKAKISME